MKLYDLPDDIFITIYKIIYADSLQTIKYMNICYDHNVIGLVGMPVIIELCNESVSYRRESY